MAREVTTVVGLGAWDLAVFGTLRGWADVDQQGPLIAGSSGDIAAP